MISVGKYTYGHETIQVFSYGCDLGNINIGAFTSIASNVKVYVNQGRGHHQERCSTYPFGINHISVFNNLKHHNISAITKGDVSIGSDVWIGDGVSITTGITIGDGAIIATNSHVTKDVHPYSIVGGNPIRHIKNRFSDDIIKEFLKLEWWSLDDHIINKILPYIQSVPTLRMFDCIYEKIKE